MNQVANRQKAEVATVREALHQMEPQFKMILPDHLPLERMLRITMTAIQSTPKLLECDRTSLFAAIMTSAQLGLEPDGVLGQAYLVPFGNKVQFIPGYRGLISLARNSGEVVSIAAHEVRENDRFDYAFGLNERCEHVPANGDRGEVTHYYAIAKFKDGGHHFDVMSVADVEKIRDDSQGYKSAMRFAKRDRDGNITFANTPWWSHPVEMGKKTMIRRIAKYLPMNVQKAAALSDAYDRGQAAHIAGDGGVTIDGDFTEPNDPPQIEGDGGKLDQFEADLDDGADDEPEPDPADKDDHDALLAAIEDLRPYGPTIEAWHHDNAADLDVIADTEPERHKALQDALATKRAEAEQKERAASKQREGATA